ncbi:MAG TPA: helix-turn-helix domain-containing protein [Solirubrobacteraceae bacterium]|nr:helix-turn-helix domain-containing protein [Solirubrobacteraceae bacterium]
MQWPTLPAPLSEHGDPHPARYCYLLDADPDLADVFDIRTRLVVRQGAIARVLDVPAGNGWVDDRVGVGARGLGALVLDGLFAVDMHVAGRTATELLGPGDLLQSPSPSPDQLLERELARRALTASRVAVLDGEFLDRMRPWPELMLALLRRADKRAAGLNLQRAVCSHPSLELRLALLLWQLAERWGRVEPSGVHLHLPLTHALLGRLVAAERPSVSRSLGRLAEHGLVSGGAGDWHLVGSVESCLDALGARSVERLHGRYGTKRGIHA